MDYIAPAKITFTSTDGYKQLRGLITSQYGIESFAILPEGINVPAFDEYQDLSVIHQGIAFKRYYARWTPTKGDTLSFLHQTDFFARFSETVRLCIEMLLSSEDETKRCTSIPVPARSSSRAVAEVFRGKSILKKGRRDRETGHPRKRSLLNFYTKPSLQ